jgi:hypothetical protein
VWDSEVHNLKFFIVKFYYTEEKLNNQILQLAKAAEQTGRMLGSSHSGGAELKY